MISLVGLLISIIVFWLLFFALGRLARDGFGSKWIEFHRLLLPSLLMINLLFFILPSLEPPYATKVFLGFIVFSGSALLKEGFSSRSWSSLDQREKGLSLAVGLAIILALFTFFDQPSAWVWLFLLPLGFLTGRAIGVIINFYVSSYSPKTTNSPIEIGEKMIFGPLGGLALVFQATTLFNYREIFRFDYPSRSGSIYFLIVMGLGLVLAGLTRAFFRKVSWRSCLWLLPAVFISTFLFKYSGYFDLKEQEKHFMPQIYRLSPDHGPAGTVVAIQGRNFGSLVNENSGWVTAIGEDPIIESWSEDEIFVKTTVPMETGPVTVVVNREVDAKISQLESFPMTFFVGHKPLELNLKELVKRGLFEKTSKERR